VALLLKNGADSSLANIEGITPQDLASTKRKNNILNLMQLYKDGSEGLSSARAYVETEINADKQVSPRLHAYTQDHRFHY